MRIFLGILGLLAVLIGVVAGVFGAIVTGSVDTDGSWKCTSTADGATGTVTQNCEDVSYASPAKYDRERDLGLEAVVGGCALFIGGCALMGGAVAGSGRKQQVVQQYPPQPVAAGGPPSYGGGGWQGGQAGETSRS